MTKWCIRLVNDQIKKKRKIENALFEVFSNKKYGDIQKLYDESIEYNITNVQLFSKAVRLEKKLFPDLNILMNEYRKTEEKLNQTLGFLELCGYELPSLKLEMEFVPYNLRGRSLFHRMEKQGRLNVWYDIKKMLVEERGYKCEICGIVPSDFLIQHEKWRYNDKKHIQYLKDLVLLCSECHNIKHFDRLLNFPFSKENLSNIQRLVNHFCKVNSCSMLDFEFHLNKQKQLCHERSFRNGKKIKWKQYLGGRFNL